MRRIVVGIQTLMEFESIPEKDRQTSFSVDPLPPLHGEQWKMKFSAPALKLCLEVQGGLESCIALLFEECLANLTRLIQESEVASENARKQMHGHLENAVELRKIHKQMGIYIPEQPNLPVHTHR